MSILIRIVVRYIVLAGLTTAVCLLIYLAVQQVSRQTANDPQLQMARDAAAQLESGVAAASVLPTSEVDITRSLSPFMAVYDSTGRPVAASVRLRGEIPVPPPGVLEFVQRNGEERVTWRPDGGVRIAAVAVRFSGGVVLAGRSLVETEERIQKYGQLIATGWGITLLALLVAVVLESWSIGALERGNVLSPPTPRLHDSKTS